MMRDVVYAFPVEFISFSHNAYTISRIIMPLLGHTTCHAANSLRLLPSPCWKEDYHNPMG